jgi:hypothetical protein
MSLQTIAHKYMNMLPKSKDGRTMPMPQFVMANMLSARWNGIAIWDGKSENCVVKVQKRIMADERSLSRIVAHEICHAWAYWMVWLGEKKSPYQRGHESTGGWAEAADLINLREGDDFVTEFSDESYMEVNDKQFYVFMTRSGGRIMWAWFSRVTPVLLGRLDRRMFKAYYDGIPMALFKTSDSRFLLKGAKLPSVACYAETPIGFEDVLDAHLKRYVITGAQFEAGGSKAQPFIQSAPVAHSPSKQSSRRALTLTWA